MALTKRERKAMFRNVDGIQKAVAAETGYATSTVSLVANDKVQLLSKDTVRKIRAALAQKVGQPVEEVWAA